MSSLGGSPRAGGSTFNQLPLICPGHSRDVVSIHFSETGPDGYFFVSACLDGRPMLRNGQTGDWIGTFLGHKGAVWDVVLNADATKVATSSADYTARVWDAISGDEIASFEHKHIVRSVDFSPTGNTIVTGGREKRLRVFDIDSQKEKVSLSASTAVSLPSTSSPFDSVEVLTSDSLSGGDGTIKSVIWVEENIIVSGGNDSFVRIWDVRDPKVVQELDHGAHSLTSMEFSSAHNLLSLSTDQREVQFWDWKTREQHRCHPTGFEVNSVSIHPSRRLYLAGGSDSLVHLCDIDTGDEFDTIKGHFGPILCTRFAPRGETFATGSGDGTIRIWQTFPRPSAGGGAMMGYSVGSYDENGVSGGSSYPYPYGMDGVGHSLDPLDYSGSAGMTSQLATYEAVSPSSVPISVEPKPLNSQAPVFVPSSRSVSAKRDS